MTADRPDQAVTVYGIRNCDTMKKALRWLDDHGIAYRLHDYKRDGVPNAALERWVDDAGWEAVLNRSGTTFRRLPEPDRTDLTKGSAIELMLANPSAIRRPVLERGDTILIGFSPDRYADLFAGR